MTIKQRRLQTASIAILLLAVGSATGAVMNLAAIDAAARIGVAFPDAAAEVAPEAAVPDAPARIKSWYLAHPYLVLASELAVAGFLGVLYAWSPRTPRSAILGALLLALPSTVLPLLWSVSFAALAGRLVLLALLVRGLLPADAQP